MKTYDVAQRERTIHNDGGIWRVLEEYEPARWITMANYATAEEARAFLEGLNYEASGREDLTASTYDRALAAVKARPRRSNR